MSDPDPQTITRLLGHAQDGDRGAADELLAAAYGKLSNIARAHFSAQSDGHTLQPTALIHEAWLKLAGKLGSVHDRTHFYAIASRAMRQVLTDHARHHNRAKGKGRLARVTLEIAIEDAVDSERQKEIDVIDLEDSIRRLEKLNARHARVVELRFLGGLTIAETARVLEVSHTTVENDWLMARAWLHTELGRSA